MLLGNTRISVVQKRTNAVSKASLRHHRCQSTQCASEQSACRRLVTGEQNYKPLVMFGKKQRHKSS